MSTGTVVKDTSNQLNVNIETANVFLGENSYERAVLSNVAVTEETFEAGTIMGRISATGLLIPLAIGATDGSQHFVGVLTENETIAASGTANVTVAIQGRVAQDKLIFNASEDLESVVGGRQLRDIIAGQGIKLVETTELSEFDN